MTNKTPQKGKTGVTLNLAFLPTNGSGTSQSPKPSVIQKNSPGRSSAVSLTVNTYSIANLSGKLWEIQSLKDLGSLISSSETEDTYVSNVNMEVDIYGFHFDDANELYGVFLPAIIIGGEGCTVTTTESALSDARAAIAEAISGANYELYLLDPISLIPHRVATAAATSENLLRFTASFDLTPFVNRFLKKGGLDGIYNKEDVPIIHLIGALRAADNGENLFVRGIVKYSIQVRPRGL